MAEAVLEEPEGFDPPLMALAVLRFASAAAEGREKDDCWPPMGEVGVVWLRAETPRL